MSQQGELEREEAQVPEPTLRDELAYHLKDVQAKETETPEQTEQRHRDEAGRFAKTPNQPEVRERRGTLTLPADKTELKSPAGAPQPTPAQKTVKAPHTWGPEAQAEFSKLPATVQAELAKREDDINRALTGQDQDRQLGKRVREISAPYMATIQAEGGNEDAAYGNFLRWAYIMRGADPGAKIQALRQVCQQFRVPIEAIASQQQFQQPNPMMQAVSPLYSKVQALEQQLEQQNQQRQYQEQRELNAEIESFAASPGHEHFDTVRDTMGRMLEAGIALDLEDAYDKAVYAIPEIRSTLTARQNQAAQAQRIAQSQAQTDAARRAAVSVTGGPGGAKLAGGATGPDDLREQIRANMRAAQGRI